MLHPKFKVLLGAMIAGCTVLSLHAQIAQDPLLTRTAAVEPNIVFMFDDSGSMSATALYQYGGDSGFLGKSGPNNDPQNCNPTPTSTCFWGITPPTPYGRSPDVNLIYYDPRVTFKRRINADGTFQPPGSTSGISSFNVYFYKPASSTNYGVSAVNVANKGSGYPATGVTATFPAPPSGGVQATATVQTAASLNAGSVTVTNRGSGYPASGVVATFTVPPAGGVQAAGTVQIANSTIVNGVTVNNKGAGYPATGVTATFSAPPAGPTSVRATGNVVINSATNKVNSVSMANIGTGYPATGVTVTFPPPATAGAVTATGNVVIGSTKRVNSVTVGSGGGGYPLGVTVTFSNPQIAGGVRATANVIRKGGTGNQPIVNINITNQGSGYTSPPTLSFSGGSGGTFLPVTMDTNSITGISITNGGSGYTSTPVPTFNGVGAGSGASPTLSMATAYMIGSIAITNRGAGYTSAPTITLGNFGTGAGATFTTTTATSPVISNITVINPGAGYTSAPTISLSGTGSGTGAAFTVNTGTTNWISGVTVTNAGSGYATQPPLTLAGTAGGTGATFGYTYASTVVPALNTKWSGTGTPTTAASYFTPSYTPDAGSPLASLATVIAYPNTADSNTATYPKFRDRTDCGAASCSWTQELQNYANWKTYHSNRRDLAKTGIGLAFQPLNPTFRLGWSTINNLNTSSTLDKGVRLFNSTTQGDFLTWLYGLLPISNPTPNRAALDKVGQYFQRGDDSGPWAGSPDGNSTAVTAGGDVLTHASCRRSYAMLMTDGYDQQPGFTFADQDSTAKSVTPTYSYTPVGPYSDAVSGPAIGNTFADVAMKYWGTDLRPQLTNSVKPTTADEADWQHLNFYAIGLGVLGTLDATNPQTLKDLTGTSSSTPPRIRDWPTPIFTGDPTAIDDMWHATVNGRGKLLNAKTAAELNSSIQQMMSDIGGNEGTQSGVAASAASLTQGTKKYTPSYTSITWNGNVTAYNLNQTTGNQSGIAWQVETELSKDPVTGAKTYSSIIPSAVDRNIYVGNGATSGARAVPFDFASMTSAGLTSSMTGTVTLNLINYLRGDATNEATSASTSSPTAIYRARTTRLGDIVSSTPVFVKDTLDLNYEKLPSGTAGQGTYRAFVDGTGTTPSGGKKQRAEGVLFVGANDGMLHAFRDGTYTPAGAVVTPGGFETFAYVPKALLPTLNQLADKAYVHRYFVDGPNIETDAYFTGGSPHWANLVLGTTGAGAGVSSSAGVSPRTAVYAIDVTGVNTSATSLNASSVLWEVSSSDSNFSELGHVLTDVQTGPTLDGKWVAIFGNGYESASCQARLYVVNLETGARIREINTGAGDCASAKNGLGGVRVVRNANQQIIGVYAGDLQGNLWKFNLNNSSSAAWGIDLGGSPLFTAGAAQPITAAPTVVPLSATSNPKGAYMVVAGTGKFYEVGDIKNPDQQSLYGILDPVAFGASTIPSGSTLTDKTLLVPQTIGSAQTAGGKTYFAISTNAVDYVGKTSPTVILPRRGWYIDFPKSGQRLVYPMELLSGRYVAADTISPANVSLDPCSKTSGGTGFLYLVDALTGAGPTVQILDTNGDGNVDSSDLLVSGLEGKADGRNVSIKVDKKASGGTSGDKYVICSGEPECTLTELRCIVLGTCGGPQKKIKSREWRQLFMR